VTALLQVRDLRKHYPVRKGLLGRAVAKVHAVDGVSFSIAERETLGLVGESGCGKSTAGKTILRLVEPTAGTIEWRGQPIERLSRTAMRPFRRELQAVFQDPYSSLNPRLRAADIVAEPLRNYERLGAAAAREKVAWLFEKVGLRPDQMIKYPHEFSGGQRQRIAIARALITRPRLIVADEPVSALDVSVQAQVLNLMQDLQDRFGVTYLFVSHDLAVVDLVCDAVIVLYQGRIVEHGDPDTLFHAAAHPYTRALLEAVPALEVVDAASSPPAVAPLPMAAGPGGCPFAPRCGFRQDRCLQAMPPLRALTPVHRAACHEAERVMALPPIVG